MNDTAIATVTLIIIAGITYGCWRAIEREQEEYKRKQEEYKGFLERLIVAIEGLPKEPVKETVAS